MSILQEYEQIRKDIGETTYDAIEKYLELRPELLLSDIYYKKEEWDQFNKWYTSTIVADEMEDFWEDVYEKEVK